MSRLHPRGPATPLRSRRLLLPLGAAARAAIGTSLFLGLLTPCLGGDGATRVNRLLTQLKQPKNGNGEIFTLSEADLNDFTRTVLGGRQRLGVKTVQIDLQEGGKIDGTAVVNMDEVQLEGFAVSMFKTLLSGTQTLKTRGRFSVRAGKGVYDIEEASFNGIGVPAWLVDSVLGYLGKRQPPHIDVTEPFDLPFGIADVRIERDKIIIVR